MGTITTTDGTEIFFKDWGSGQPIVFSHGWRLSADDWDTQLLCFLEHGHRVIAHDRRGHGRSRRSWSKPTPIPVACRRACSTIFRPSASPTYKGFPHDMPTAQAEMINPDLLAFVQS